MNQEDDKHNPDRGDADAHRPVRSFVRREGRLTRAQASALETLWPVHGIEWTGEMPDLDAAFGRTAPRCLDIGFGNGDTLIWLAQEHPHIDYLGVEVHRPGVGRVLHEIEKHGLDNVRVMAHDAIEVLAALPRGSLAQVLLLFPDPWPKKRHHKRRIVQPAFLEAVSRVLGIGGRLHMATDWMPYAEHMDDVITGQTALVPCDDAGELPGPDARPATRFERRGTRLGHDVRDFILRRT